MHPQCDKANRAGDGAGATADGVGACRAAHQLTLQERNSTQLWPIQPLSSSANSFGVEGCNVVVPEGAAVGAARCH
ncbi:unnamed protein product, partial [Closterium sp. Naga37s-1]